MIILSFGVWLRLHGSTRPLVGYFDGGRTALQARNFRAMSISEHRFRPIDNPRPESFLAYMNHPPFVLFFSAAMDRIMTPPEFAFRLGSVIFSTLTTFLFFYLTWRTVSMRAGVLTAGMASVAPVGSYYGGTAFVHDVAFVFFATALLTVLVLRPSGKGTLFLCSTTILFGVFSDVHFNYLPFIAASIYYLRRDKIRVKLSLFCCGATLVGFFLLLMYVHISSGDAFSPFRSAMNRTGYSVLLSLSFYASIWNYLNITMTPVGVWVALVVAIGLVLRKSPLFYPLQTDRVAGLMTILFLFGLIPVLVFPAGAEMHIFWVYSFFPFFAIVFGAGLARSRLVVSVILLVGLAYPALIQWSRMKVQNDYRAYEVGSEVSNLAASELVYADENPNLLWYYLQNPIHNINGFQNPEDILPSANRENVDFIVTSGAYIIPATEPFVSTFAPLYEEGGYLIYIRRARLEELTRNWSASWDVEGLQAQVSVPDMIPIKVKVNLDEVASASNSTIVVYWSKSDGERRVLLRGAIVPRMITTSSNGYISVLIFMDSEYEEGGTLSVHLEGLDGPSKLVASYSLDLKPRWPLFPRWWWNLFPRQ